MRQQQQGAAYPIQRASRTHAPARRLQHPPANPNRAGHYAGFHPEDQPFNSDDVYEDVEEDDSYYETRVPTSSVRRYVPPLDPQVIQQGNKRLVMHRELPKPRLHYHPLTYIGLAMIIMLSGWMLVTLLGVWWNNKQEDWQFGNPRTFQVDRNVGHGNSQTPDSHFIAVNLNGLVQVIEEPGNDASKAHIYDVTTLQGGDGSTPVTLSFRDINGDGKLDMLINIGDGSNNFTLYLFNTGAGFASKL